MSITAEAIQRIEQLSQAAHAMPATKIPAVLAPDGAQVIDLEKYQEHPARLRQVFKTERIDDFVKYVVNHAGDEYPTVYVAPTGDSAEAILDHGSSVAPEWGQHRAKLALVKTREYQALEGLCAQPRSQQDLIDYLEDWALDGLVECLVNGEPVGASAAIAAVRRVDLKATEQATHVQDNFSASRTAIEQIEARGAAGSLPGHIKLMAPMYVGTGQRDIYARIGVRAGKDGQPAFGIRVMQLDKLVEEVAREVEQTLIDKLRDECEVFVGHVTR